MKYIQFAVRETLKILGNIVLFSLHAYVLQQYRAVFVRFSLGEEGQSFDWRLATIAGMEVAKLVPWNSLLN